ncbi:MAG: sensor domain-containing diguanylate cyclase [Bauldia sp.]|nr:sensor domain-containing diguanylate cyclase [Bauldia sp.]
MVDTETRTDAADTETRRLAALASYDILDTPPEENFDRIGRMIRRLFKVPISIISFIDGDRQWYKASEGMGVSQVPRESSFCKRTIETGKPLIVEDASTDPRFADNPYVTGDPGVRFYLSVPLTTKDGFHIGTVCVIDTKARQTGPLEVELLAEFADMAMDELELRNRATRDALTGCLSRRAFREEASRTIALSLRHDLPLALITFDLDHFKSINDTFGHAAGDEVLKAAAATIMRTMRRSDVLGRLGGEEFGVLLPNTDLAGAFEAAERMRSVLAEREVDIGGRTLTVTASFGVAAAGNGVETAEALLARADEGLYSAKRSGRNRSAAAS